MGSGEVVLRVLAGGICGSDVPKFRGQKAETRGPTGEFRPGRPGYPLHEVVGEVVASRHADVGVGHLVVGWASSSDGLAEYIVTDGNQLNDYDTTLAPDVAVLIQPLACVLYALESVAVRGKHAAVMGLGPIGLLFAHALRAGGARTVTGIDPVDRSQQARSFGIGDVCPTTGANWARHVAPGDRPELVIEAVGHQTQTLNDALAGVAVGGTVLSFGIPDTDIYPVNVELLMRKNVTLIGGVTRDRRRALAAADSYLRAHPDLPARAITGVFGRDQAQPAFELACVPAPGRLKLVVSMT